MTGGHLSAQVVKDDSLDTSLRNDTLPGDLQVKGDTLAMPKEKGDIETTIKYSAKDSIRMDVVNKKVYLYGDAKINYGDITLTAALVSIDWQNSLMTANALPDSTGKLKGIPVFNQAGETYEAEEIRYNFKTKKGIISNIVTKQGEGYVTGTKVKRDEDAIYINSAQYTTCNLSHPHFYINARRLKVVPDDKVVSGPFNLVISDVHTPLGFFLGFFPIPKKQKSGLLFPTVGMSAQRGLFLSRGGYYWAINDYINFKVLGDAYSNGSYNVTASSDYNVRYKYNGSLSFTGAKTKNSFSLGESPIQSFNLIWSHRTAVKKNRSFQANVNVYSQKYFANNSFNPTAINTNASTSSIIYTKAFGRSPFNISVAARQDQNIRNAKTVMNFTLPEINFAMNRVSPFKRKIGSGDRWYEKINISYNLSTKYFATNLPISYGVPLYIDPSSNAKERTDTISLAHGGFADVLKAGQWGAKHTIPISTTMKVMKYFNMSPSFTFNQYFYDKYLDYLTNQTPIKARVVKGFTTTYDFNFSNNLTTRIYGTYNLKSKKLLAIRHTAVPTFNYTYHPDFSSSGYNNYEKVNPLSQTATLSRFNSFVYGGPGAGKVNSVGFGITNTLEGKIRSNRDTANPIKKVNLFDNISANGSYNFADKDNTHMNLSLIQVNARTTLFKTININFATAYDPYPYRLDSTGTTASKTIYQTRLNPKTLSPEVRAASEFKRSQTYTINISAGLNPNAFKPKTTTKPKNAELDFINANPDLYIDFKIPWNLNISYNFNYSRIGFQKKNVTQALQLTGDLRVTENWKISFTSGYDFVNKGVSYTTLTINRDLHCWQASFNVVPFGTRQSYFFTLSAKSSILQDLKLNKRSPAYIGY